MPLRIPAVVVSASVSLSFVEQDFCIHFVLSHRTGSISTEHTEILMAAERTQAENVRAALGISLIVLLLPSIEDFTLALSRFVRRT